MVALTSDGRAFLLATGAGAEPRELSCRGNNLTQATISADGTTVAISGGPAGLATTCLVRANGSGDVLTFGPHAEEAGAIALSADGTQLATASWDGLLRGWRVQTAAATLDFIRAAKPACLAPLQRQSLLGESASDASTGSEACRSRRDDFQK